MLLLEVFFLIVDDFFGLSNDFVGVVEAVVVAEVEVDAVVGICDSDESFPLMEEAGSLTGRSARED